MSLELPVRAGWAAAATSAAAPDAAQTGGAGAGQRPASRTQVTKGGARGLIGGRPGAVTQIPCVCVVLRVRMCQGAVQACSQLDPISSCCVKSGVWECQPGQADMACGRSC